MATILVADDATHVAEAIQLVLKTAGHTVIVAFDGAAALEYLLQYSFDLAVLDIWMPKKSGLDVLKEIRRVHPAMPVVLVSGGGPGATLEQATMMADLYKASQVLYKPFEDEELLEAVDAALALH